MENNIPTKHFVFIKNQEGDIRCAYDLNKIVFARRTSDKSVAIWLEGMVEPASLSWDDKEHCDAEWTYLINYFKNIGINGQK